MNSRTGKIAGAGMVLSALILLAGPRPAAATPYIGASYGWTNGHSSDFEDSSGTAWRVFAGSWGTIFGAELGYGKLTGFKDHTVNNVDISAWDASLLAGVPLGPVRLFGRAGAVYTTTDVANSSSHDWNYKYGVGVDTHFGPMGVRFEWDRFPVKSDRIDADVDVASAALMFRF